MAGLLGDVNIVTTSLTATTTYYVVVIAAPTNQRIRIRGLKLYGASNSAQTPGLLTIGGCTSIGTGGNTVTPVPREGENTETFQGTYKTIVTGAPTGITIGASYYVNPQLGIDIVFQQEESYYIKGGTWWQIGFVPAWTGAYTGSLLIEE